MSDTEITHHETPKAGAFIAAIDGKRAGELTYTREPGRLVAEHTFVDPAFRGGSVARELLAALVAHARATGQRIAARCVYVKGVFERHPDEYADVATPL